MPGSDLPRSRLSLPQLLPDLAVFVLLVASIVLLWRRNELLLGVLLAQAVAVLYLWHDERQLALFFVIAVLGSLAELVFVRFGVWRYSNPTLLGVPVWFPVSFGIAGVTGCRLADTLAGFLVQENCSPHDRRG